MDGISLGPIDDPVLRLADECDRIKAEFDPVPDEDEKALYALTWRLTTAQELMMRTPANSMAGIARQLEFLRCHMKHNEIQDEEVDPIVDTLLAGIRGLR
jgi:hypothetical protein